MDKTLLDEIDYKSDLEAGRKGFVFKFADRPTLYFGCQLRLELKSEWNQACRVSRVDSPFNRSPNNHEAL
jgi:hypothetical protein